MQLKAKFGSGKKNGNYNDERNHKNWKSSNNLNISDQLDGFNGKFGSKYSDMTNRNGGTKEGNSKVAFTPPTSKKTGGIGLKWEMQHSHDSSTFPSASISSWKKNVFSKSHSNIQDLAVDDKRGFVPSEVAKDPNQKEFLINLSKRIFSNPDTKVIQEEMQRRRRTEINNENRKRALSAGRNTGLDNLINGIPLIYLLSLQIAIIIAINNFFFRPLKMSTANGYEHGRFQRTFKVLNQIKHAIAILI